MNLVTSLQESTIKALLAGGIGAVGSTLLLKEYGSSNLFGARIPNFALIGATTGASSWVSDMVSDNIIRQIPQVAGWAQAESLAVRLGVCAASTAAIMRIVIKIPSENTMKAALFGAGCKVSSEWVFNNVISQRRTLGF